MTQDEIKALTEAVTKGGDTLTNYVKGLKPINPDVTLDGVKKFLAEDESGKSYLQSETDKRVTDGIETFKKKNLQKLIDEEYKKQHPEADPKDTKLAEMEKKLEDIQKEAIRKDLTNKALKVMTEKKLPVDLVDYFIGTDETATMANLNGFAKILEAHDKGVKEDLLKQNQYTPPAGGNGGSDSFAHKIIEQSKRADKGLETARENYFK